MNREHRVPQNDFRVIEYFESYIDKDEDSAVKMVEFYQEQRDRSIPLAEAFLSTLQHFSSVTAQAA